MMHMYVCKSVLITLNAYAKIMMHDLSTFQVCVCVCVFVFVYGGEDDDCEHKDKDA